MRPPISMVFFTTLAGAAQGVVLALVALQCLGALGLMAAPPWPLVLAAAVSALALGGLGLFAATFHLGRPARAWRAAAMWRTSWLSREVIVLPTFLACVFVWGAAAHAGIHSLAWGLAAALLAGVLYLCTGMIYAAVAVMREWATPLTPLNFAVWGLASGSLLAAALAAWWAPTLSPLLAHLGLATALLGGITRGAAWWRNAHLVRKTTLQTALGVRHPRIVQTSQGSMGGTSNTREFMHGQPAQRLVQARWLALALACALPVGVLVATQGHVDAVGLSLLFVLQWLGLMADRWVFFAEAQHPQNLYHQGGG